MAFATPFAQTVNIGDLWYTLDEENMTAEVIMSFKYWSQQYENYSYLQGDVVIPSTITYKEASYTVTSIGGSAFCYTKEIKSVALPSTITSIGIRAFEKSGIKSIYIPASVDTINTMAFCQCDSLENVYIDDLKSWCNTFISKPNVYPDDNEDTPLSQPLKYASNLYVGGVKTTDLVFPDSIISIGDYAFTGFRGLHSITIASEKMQIGKNAFYGCRNLESVTFPEHISKLSDKTFGDCTGLVSIDISSIDGDYGKELFRGCINLRNVRMPMTISKLSMGMFQDCSSLEEVLLPDSLTVIDSRAFMGCTSIKNIIFPANLHTIESQAFCGCVCLENIIFPKELKSIGGKAFENCIKVISIDLPIVKKGYGHDLFRGCTSLKYVKMPDTVDILSDGMFDGCSNLEEITLPSSLNTIGDRAFMGCSVLKSIVFPGNLQIIGSSAFSGCLCLEDIVFPNKLEFVSDLAFQGCHKLQSVSLLASGVDFFGERIFEDCPLFNQVHINDLRNLMCSYYEWFDSNPLYYAHNLYLNDELVTDIVVPEDIWEINFYAFSGCRCLKTVTINHAVLIWEGAFYDCGCDIRILGNVESNARSLAGSKENKNTIWAWRNTVSMIMQEFEDYPDDYANLGFANLYVLDNPIFNTGPTTIRIDSIDIDYPDLQIDDFWLEGNGRVLLSCLPGQENTIHYFFKNPFGETISSSYIVTTPSLEFQKTKITMVDKDIVIAETKSNMWDEQSNIGIHYEIIPIASDETSSVITEGAICDGIILARVKLNDSMTRQPLKIRPFYEDKKGNNYYGEWEVFDPTHYQHVDAIVYTSPNKVTSISKVSLKGYCLSGEGQVVECGFKLTSISSGQVSVYPYDDDNNDYNKIVSMTIDSLDKGEYMYCFYAKIGDELSYGDTYRFAINESTNIPVSFEITPAQTSKGVYTLQGVKVANYWEHDLNLPPGIYIVNGKKMVIK